MTVRGVIEWWRESGKLGRLHRLVNRNDPEAIAEVGSWTLNEYNRRVRLARSRRLTFTVGYVVGSVLVTRYLGPLAYLALLLIASLLWSPRTNLYRWETEKSLLGFIQDCHVVDRMQSGMVVGYNKPFEQWLDLVEKLIADEGDFTLQPKAERNMVYFVSRLYRPGVDIIEWGKAPVSRIVRLLGAYGSLPETGRLLHRLAEPHVWSRARPGLYRYYTDAVAAYDSRHPNL